MREGPATQSNIFKAYDIDTGEEMEGLVTIELPNQELGTNEYKGAGMGGAINVPTPGVLNAQTATLSTPLINKALVKYMELGVTRGIDLRNEVIVLNKDTHALEKVPNRWVIKGPLSNTNPGKVEQGASGDASIVIQVYYMHHWIDGEDVLEWDPFKGIYTVNGKDLMEETRKNVFVG